MNEENKKIKLVLVIADSSLGGGPQHVLGILKHIDQKKFEPFLVCPSGFLSVEGKLIDGVTVFNFNPRSKFDLKAMLDLRRIFHKIRAQNDPFGPMIIHSHGPRAGLMARMVSVFGLKTVYTEHRYDQDYHLKNPLNELVQKKILKAQNARTNLIIAVSSSVKSFLVENGLATDENTVVIPNAIEIKEESGTKKVRLANKAPVIGTIGNLNIQKGHEYLLEAMTKIRKKYPLATLEIIGEGEERKNLEEQIKILKLDHHVALLGNKRNIRKYLKGWDVFVLPSIAETFGIVVLEAMREGVPVVASKVGGIVDIITHKKSGILISSKDPNQIADGIAAVIDHPALAAKLKREGKERIKHFDWKVVIKKLEEEYEKLVRSRE